MNETTKATCADTAAVGTSGINTKRSINLPTGCRVRLDETRSMVELPLPRIRGDCNNDYTETKNNQNDDRNMVGRRRWKSISSAIWNGGLRSFTSKTERSNARRVCVFNYKVPSTYNGLDPEPKEMLQNAMRNNYDALMRPNHTSDDLHEETTIGIMTAASMGSLRTATRSAGGVVVDAIVTAGISNARTAGASADYFEILPPECINKNLPPPGTINTVVVINGVSLTETAMIEAYAITIEAKCGACADYSIACAKNSRQLAQGTGTDCAVLLCPTIPDNFPASNAVAYAGKHCLLAELIGQAVREATKEAILSNIHHLYGGGDFGLVKYHLHRLYKELKSLALEGARPCIPAKPMDPVPNAPLEVSCLGMILLLICYNIGNTIIPRSVTILLAAAVWDRYLPEPPLSFHPVVLAGTMISLATKQYIPDTVFSLERPVLGVCSGAVFLVVTLFTFVSGAITFMFALRCVEDASTAAAVSENTSVFYLFFYFQIRVVKFALWMLEVILFKTTFSLQLLCTIALQMAAFLERKNIQEARAQLSWLCSRDPSHLNSEELAGGTLESLSENLSDGTAAPIFWYVLFGPIGALCYRIANTLDSRIGYRGGRYEYFGKASARFDDLINLIPARLTALSLIFASCAIDGCNAKNGWLIAFADQNQCASPNAGWPMGAMAGILGVRLEKKGEYCLGISLGDSAIGPTPLDIRKGHKVVQLAGGIVLMLAVFVCTLREALS